MALVLIVKPLDTGAWTRFSHLCGRMKSDETLWHYCVNSFRDMLCGPTQGRLPIQTNDLSKKFKSVASAAVCRGKC